MEISLLLLILRNWWLGGEQDSTVKVEGRHSLKVVDSDDSSDMAAISRHNIRISKG